MNLQRVFIWSETILWCIHNNVYTVIGIAAWLLLLCWKRTLTLSSGWNHKQTHWFFCAFPHKFNQYLLKVSVTSRGNTASASSHSSCLTNVKMSLGDCKRVHSFLSSRWVTGWLTDWLAVDIQGLSRAVKRTYCCIPAPTTALSHGFTTNKNCKLIPPNSQSTYSFLTNHFVYSACWIKQPISVHLCP